MQPVTSKLQNDVATALIADLTSKGLPTKPVAFFSKALSGTPALITSWFDEAKAYRLNRQRSVMVTQAIARAHGYEYHRVEPVVLATWVKVYGFDLSDGYEV